MHGWSLPKGLADPNESSKVAAVRECFEETGLDFTDSSIIDLGRYKYTSQKDYHLHALRVSNAIEPTKLSCSTFFIHNEQEYPEVDKYMWVSLEHAVGSYLSKKQAEIIAQNLKYLKELSS